MRHNYVGDDWDYNKYGLLRALAKDDLKLGIIWYLYTDPCKPGDGNSRKYLDPKRMQPDADLHSSLSGIIANPNRTVGDIAKAGILPKSTAFYEESLSFLTLSKSQNNSLQQRKEYRQKWFDAALNATADCDIVFIDPDNGLQVKSVSPYRDYGAKYATYEEVKALWDKGKSVIIYQHRARQTLAIQTEACKSQLLDHLGKADLRVLASPSQIFLILIQPRHLAVVGARIDEFNRQWQPLVSLI